MKRTKTQLEQTTRRIDRLGRPVSGLSLLEVVLALAILGAAVAVMTQALQVAADAAIRTREVAAAELLAESKMAEVIAGSIPVNQSVTSWTQEASKSATSKSVWYYKMISTPAAMQGILSVQIQVTNDPERTTGQPIDFTLVRWVIDPNLGLDALPQESTDPNAASGSNTAGTGNSTGNNSAGGLQ